MGGMRPFVLKMRSATGPEETPGCSEAASEAALCVREKGRRLPRKKWGGDGWRLSQLSRPYKATPGIGNAQYDNDAGSKDWLLAVPAMSTLHVLW